MPGLPPGKDPDALPSYHQPQLPGSSSAAQVLMSWLGFGPGGDGGWGG